MNDWLSEVKYSVQENGSVERSVSIEIPRHVYDKQYKDKLNRAVSVAQLKGFRPGRAPRALVDKVFGMDIQNETTSNLIHTAYKDVLSKQDWRIAGPISLENIDFPDDGPISAAFRVYLYPEFEITQSEGLDVEVEVQCFDESQVDHQIQHIAENFGAKIDITDRDIVQIGDVVDFNYTTYVNGEPIKRENVITDVDDGTDLSHQVMTVSASGQRDFSTYLVGHRVGEDFEVHVPGFENQIKSKTSGEQEEGNAIEVKAHYRVKINKLMRIDPHEKNDELAKKAHFDGTFEEFRAFLSDLFSKRVERENRDRRELALFKKLIEIHPFQLPETMILAEIKQILKSRDIKGDEGKELTDEEVKSYRDFLEDQAVYQLKRSLITEKLQNSLGVVATKEQQDAFIERVSDEMAVMPEIFREYLERKPPEERNYMFNRYALTERLIGSTNFIEKKLPAETCAHHR